MKRTLHAALAAAMALGLALPTSAARIGAVVGHTYYTDIAAQIDGHPLRSYNIGGETAVVAEDLREYGFSVVWNGEARTLTVERDLEGAVTGDYHSPNQAQTVGAVSGDIYSTDIKTYVQGEEVESFALNGETAISFSQLERAGTLTWDGSSRTASLTLAADPMEFVLEQKERELKDSPLSYRFERYPGPKGTLAVYGQGGTPHGSACMMLYVAANGRQVQIDNLLPNYGFGAQYYLEPREIAFDETGDTLSFITPVKSETGDWGDTRCVFDTAAGTIRSLTPLGQPMGQ